MNNTALCYAHVDRVMCSVPTRVYRSAWLLLFQIAIYEKTSFELVGIVVVGFVVGWLVLFLLCYYC